MVNPFVVFPRTRAALLLLLAVPATADPAGISATLEALRSQAADDPAAFTSREDASARAGRSFDRSFTFQPLRAVDSAPLGGAPRRNPSVRIRERLIAPDQSPGEGPDYSFEGKKPFGGISIYAPAKGRSSAAGGKRLLIGGVALLGVGLALGGTPLGALALVGGLLIGAGSALSFLS